MTPLPLVTENTSLAIDDTASDYGSDISDITADQLLTRIESPPLSNIALEDIIEPEPRDETWVLRIGAYLSQLRETLDDAKQSGERISLALQAWQAEQLRTPARRMHVEVEYDESNRGAFSPTSPLAEPSSIPDAGAGHTQKSPLQRFRTWPKKPLSVTDLVSPAWCEQQYDYSLSKYGRVRKTPAMRQGSSVHRELEEQVHVQVPVKVISAEDRFGLRIWNTIQGLRTLRQTGLTRELEVWGVIEGQVVIGVIDEVSTVCPDADMEAEVLQARSQNRHGKVTETLPADQRTLDDFMTRNPDGIELQQSQLFSSRESTRNARSTYYIVDVKTRQSRTLPSQGSASKPTEMQLMLYHRLLSALANDSVPPETIFARYALKPDAPFSDEFVVELSNLDMYNQDPSTQNSSEFNSSQNTQLSDPLSELLEYNSLTALWSLLTTECALTFPKHPSKPTISLLLTVEFRTAVAAAAAAAPISAIGDHDSPAGTLLGRRSFALDTPRLDAYIADEMSWWRGERPTRGVDVEDAFKCRICEFAEICTWRATKVEEGIRKARLRKEGKKVSSV